MEPRITILGAVVIAAVVIVGSWVRSRRSDRRLTGPIGAVAWLYGIFLVLYLVETAFAISDGAANEGPGSICVTTYLMSQTQATPGYSARAGAAISAIGHTQACALHPGVLQLVLFLLTKLPSIVVWGGVLLLIIWRLTRQAARGGPFTTRVAVAMRQLGWLVIVGSVVAAALGALGTDLLARMLMTPAPWDGHLIVLDVLVSAPLQALVPVPLLAGVTLMCFARIIRAGAVLDEEVKATV
jgi:hypothetical protein